LEEFPELQKSIAKPALRIGTTTILPETSLPVKATSGVSIVLGLRFKFVCSFKKKNFRNNRGMLLNTSSLVIFIT